MNQKSPAPFASLSIGRRHMTDGAIELVADGGTVEPDRESEPVQKPKEPIGISEFLPRAAAMRLAQGVATARMYPVNSFERRRALEDAIVAVKDRWPEYFRKE